MFIYALRFAAVMGQCNRYSIL